MEDQVRDYRDETDHLGELIGRAEVLDISRVPDGTGDGFIRALAGTEFYLETEYRIGPARPGQEEDALAENHPFPHPFEKEIRVSPGDYRIEFRIMGDACPPAPLQVTVRPGLGVIIVVSYFHRRDLERWEEEALAVARSIRSLLSKC